RGGEKEGGGPRWAPGRKKTQGGQPLGFRPPGRNQWVLGGFFCPGCLSRRYLTSGRQAERCPPQSHAELGDEEAIPLRRPDCPGTVSSFRCKGRRGRRILSFQRLSARPTGDGPDTPVGDAFPTGGSMLARPRCPESRDLQRLLLGQLPDWRAEQLEQHVLQCDACLRALRALEVDDALLRALRTRGDVPRPAEERAVAGL